MVSECKDFFTTLTDLTTLLKDCPNLLDSYLNVLSIYFLRSNTLYGWRKNPQYDKGKKCQIR